MLSHGVFVHSSRRALVMSKVADVDPARRPISQSVFSFIPKVFDGLVLPELNSSKNAFF